MKSRVLLYSFLVLTYLVSCKKENNNSFDCNINGVESMNAKVGDAKILNITISKTRGIPENVELLLNNVPQGVVYAFETQQGVPNFATTLTIVVTNEIKLGNYSMTLEAKSENFTKSIDFNLSVTDSITMQMKVYDATQWTLDSPAGELCDSAVINLYKDSVSFAQHNPFYTTLTDENGMANFYHVPAGTYLFTADKGPLSNIVSKTLINSKLMGFATANIDKYGQLQYRDENGDGKINDLDRVQNDMLIIYQDFYSDRIVWIGQ
jgi:hypothetical protein